MVTSSSSSMQRADAARSAFAIAGALATLKDVAGIAGSFVFSHKGQLFAREIHPMFDDVTLAETAARLIRLHDTFAAVGDHLDLAIIRYQDHRLYLKVLDSGLLCILADGVVNMAALRMAANLVGRRIAAELARVDSSDPESRLVPAAIHAGALPRDKRQGQGQGMGLSRASDPDATPPPVEAVMRAPAVAAPGVRRFRGRILGS